MGEPLLVAGFWFFVCSAASNFELGASNINLGACGQLLHNPVFGFKRFI